MQIKIVDFGLSSTYESGELLRTACGSPCYAAPEMIGGRKYEGLLADIWSCGIILYAMVCGFLPFEDQNTAILYKKILSGDFEIPNYLSIEIVSLLKAILNIDINKRYRIEDIKRDKWFNLFPNDYSPISYYQINSQVLNEIKKYNIEPGNAIRSIDANSHDIYTTIYYLAYKKLQREGNLSTNAIIGQQEKDKKEEVPNRINEDYSNNIGEIIDKKGEKIGVENVEILKYDYNKRIFNPINISHSLNRKNPSTKYSKSKAMIRKTKYGLKKQTLSISPDRSEIKSSKPKSTKTDVILQRGFGQRFSSNPYNNLGR